MVYLLSPKLTVGKQLDKTTKKKRKWGRLLYDELIRTLHFCGRKHISQPGSLRDSVVSLKAIRLFVRFLTFVFVYVPVPLLNMTSDYTNKLLFVIGLFKKIILCSPCGERTSYNC